MLLPGEYTPRQEVAILHTIPQVRGALPLLAREEASPPEVNPS